MDEQIEKTLAENTVVLEVPGKAGRKLQPGDVLGDNYVLKALIGSGGMGVVYLCEHQIIGQEYALKIIRPDQINEVTWQRFQVEAKTIARLEHPSIVRLFNMGIYAGDCPYYVMELLRGDSLDTYIKATGALPFDEAMRIFCDLVAALGYAHSRHIVHRDIKPSNIILEKNGSGTITPKIVDFGLAKLVNQHTAEGQALTVAGDVFGSPLYMSPEQGLGAAIDQRSDIYSLGCVMFKMLTGEPPFHGDSALQTIFMHQEQEAPRLRAVAKKATDIPQFMEVMIGKMLAKKPQYRYQSMDEIMLDIRKAQEPSTLLKAGAVAALEANNDSPTQDDSRIRKKMIGPPFLSLLIGLAAVCIGIIFISLKNPHQNNFRVGNEGPYGGTTGNGKTNSTTIATVQPDSKERTTVFGADTSHAPQKDALMESVRVAFATFQPRATKVGRDASGSLLTFYFPNTAVGVMSNGRDEKKQAAGAMTMHGTEPITLEIKSTSHRFTMANPWILERIDKTHIDTIVFSDIDMADAGQAENAPSLDPVTPVLQMLDIVKSWSHLQTVRFEHFKASKALLDKVQTMPGLQCFTLRTSDNKGSELAPYPFLQKLRLLIISEMTDIDPLLFALSHNQNLQLLTIDSTQPSPAAVAALASCQRLYSLQMEQMPVSEALLEAVTRLQSLTRLSMTTADCAPEKVIKLMPKLKNLKVLSISQRNWTPEQIKSLKEALPDCLIKNPKDKTGSLKADDI